MTPAGHDRRASRRLRWSGVFESGHYEYDSSLALINIDDAEKLYRLDNYTGIRLKLADMQQAPEVSQKLVHTLEPGRSRARLDARRIAAGSRPCRSRSE